MPRRADVDEMKRLRSDHSRSRLKTVIGLSIIQNVIIEPGNAAALLLPTEEPHRLDRPLDPDWVHHRAADAGPHAKYGAQPRRIIGVVGADDEHVGAVRTAET